MATRKIIDGKGTDNLLKIGHEGEIGIVQHPHPPVNEVIAPLPFSQFFTDDGTSTGNEDMRVNGSSTNVVFSINAQPTLDIYIKSITVQISDNGATLAKFGALAELTNGLQFYYNNIMIGQLMIADNIKTNLDFFRDATGGKGFGDGTGSWKADISGSGKDTYFPEYDLNLRFGLIWGLRLIKGSTDQIVFKVRDNLSTGIEDFNIKGYGIRI